MGGVVSDNLGRASGLVKAVSAGGGKVLQVVGATHATESETNATTYIDSGLDVAITPSATSSKILIFATLSITYYAGASFYFTLFRGATDLSDDDAQGMLQTTAVTGAHKLPASFLFLDSPDSTSELTYSVYGKAAVSGNTLKMCSGGTAAAITAFEIDGS
tara:strand:+ start:65 stop:547 length:483 start_codon:yes stop_codon:yes gene_type:complete